MPNPPVAAEARIPVDTLRRRARAGLKGRQPTEAARDAVRRLIGFGPYARDQLIVEEGHAAFDARRHAHLVLLHQQLVEIGAQVVTAHAIE